MDPIIEAFSSWPNAWRTTMPAISVWAVILTFGAVALGIRGIADVHAFLRSLRD